VCVTRRPLAHDCVHGFLARLGDPAERSRVARTLDCRQCRSEKSSYSGGMNLEKAPATAEIKRGFHPSDARSLVGCPRGSGDAPSATKEPAEFFSPAGPLESQLVRSLVSLISLPSGSSTPTDSLRSNPE
jgi:hypothetical protein